jgi:transposase-like protein
MTDARREEARRLRVDPGLSLSELMKQFGVGSATLTDWLRGVEPPAWTRRPNAKDELRVQALRLRADGWSVNDLAVRLGVAKSTAYAWVKHVPLDPDAERAGTSASMPKSWRPAAGRRNARTGIAGRPRCTPRRPPRWRRCPSGTC